MKDKYAQRIGEIKENETSIKGDSQVRICPKYENTDKNAAFEHARTIWLKQNGCRYIAGFFLLHQP